MGKCSLESASMLNLDNSVDASLDLRSDIVLSVKAVVSSWTCLFNPSTAASECSLSM